MYKASRSLMRCFYSPQNPQSPGLQHEEGGMNKRTEAPRGEGGSTGGVMEAVQGDAESDV